VSRVYPTPTATNIAATANALIPKGKVFVSASINGGAATDTKLEAYDGAAWWIIQQSVAGQGLQAFVNSDGVRYRIRNNDAVNAIKMFTLVSPFEVPT